MKLRVRYVLLLVLLSGSIFSLKAQQVMVKASIDSTHILIGDQLKLLLEIEKPKKLDVRFPMVPDTFSSKIEVVSRSKVDTLELENKEREKLVQQLLITSFDSGMYQIPPFYFRLKDGQMLDSAATRALAFRVHGMKIDTTKGPADIKTVYGAPVTLKEVTPYILGIILIAAIIFFIFYYIKWKKKNVPLFAKPEKPAEPAHIIALRELDRIKTQKLWQQERIKQYYSEVSDTIRAYIENRFGIPAMEQTSSETIGTFKQNNEMVDGRSLDQLQHILSLADLVKFAKYNPLVDDNNLTLMNAYFFVNQTKKEEVKAPEKPVENQEELVTES
jgi:predicted secreted protein